MASDSTEKRLHLAVITPARTVLETEAHAVVVPAFDGELGVLPGHAALLSLLGTGLARITLPDGSTRKLAIRGGFLQVSQDKVTVLTPESAVAGDVKMETLNAEVAKLDAEHPVQLEEREALAARRAWLRARRQLVAP